MRQRNPKGRYIEGEIGKGNIHSKSLQVSLELYIICYTFNVCVCMLPPLQLPLSYQTAIVLSKLLGREGNLNVYLTCLWLIPNWAYSTLLPFLCLCASFIHHALFSPSYAPRWLGGQYTISWWKEKPPPASNCRIFGEN